MLAISFVQYLSGFRADLNAIGDICKRHQCFFFVDAIQGLGAFPLDVEAAHIDALAADGHKWLLGPEGCGILYVRKSRQDSIFPEEFGWTNVAGYNDYASRDMALRQDAGRYECGTLNTIGCFGLRASMELLLEAGIERIAPAVQDAGRSAGVGALNKGYQLLGDRTPENGAGIIAIQKPGLDSRKVVHDLKQKGILAAPRQGWVRLSPHFYISPEEIDRVIEAALTHVPKRALRRIQIPADAWELRRVGWRGLRKEVATSRYQPATAAESVTPPVNQPRDSKRHWRATRIHSSDQNHDAQNQAEQFSRRHPPPILVEFLQSTGVQVDPGSKRVRSGCCGSAILLINHAVLIHDEGVDTGHAVVGRPGHQRKSADHGSSRACRDVVRRARSALLLQHAEEVTVIGPRGIRPSRFGEFFWDRRTSQRSPRTPAFPRRCASWRHIAPARLRYRGASLDGVQLVRANLPRPHFNGAALGVEAPLLAIVHQRNRKWPVLIADQKNHDVRIHRRLLQVMFLGGDFREFLPLGFILLGIAGSKNPFGRRSQHGLQRGCIILRCSVDQRLGGGLGRVKSLLAGLRILAVCANTPHPPRKTKTSRECSCGHIISGLHHHPALRRRRSSATAPESSATATEPAGVAHAGKSVVALHARRASVLDSAKSAMIGRALLAGAKMTLRWNGRPGRRHRASHSAKRLPHLEPRPLRGNSPFREIRPRLGTARNRPIGIRHSHSMARIMRPHAAQPKPR